MTILNSTFSAINKLSIPCFAGHRKHLPPSYLYLTLPYREDILPLSAEASNGPNAHRFATTYWMHLCWIPPPTNNKSALFLMNTFICQTAERHGMLSMATSPMYIHHVTVTSSLVNSQQVHQIKFSTKCIFLTVHSVKLMEWHHFVTYMLDYASTLCCVSQSHQDIANKYFQPVNIPATITVAVCLDWSSTPGTAELQVYVPASGSWVLLMVSIHSPSEETLTLYLPP